MIQKFKRARKDYPDGVLGIYDNGGKTADRYTVVYAPYEQGAPFHSLVFPLVDMSASPYWPQGACMHSETVGYRVTGGWGTGQKVISFNELPTDCQRVVREDLA